MTVHCGHDPVPDPRRDGGAQRRHHRLHDRGFVRREPVQHEVTQHGARHRCVGTDSDAEPRVLHGAERRLDAAEAVVAAGRPLGAEPERAEREGDVIDDDEQVVGDRPEGPLDVGSERVTAEVHERLGLQQADAAPVHLAVRGAGVRCRAPRGKTPNVGQVVNDPPADVVTRGLVFGTRVAEADDELHGSGLD
jgi:hypothetical protein